MQELISLIKNLIAVIGDALPMAKLDIKKAFKPLNIKN